MDLKKYFPLLNCLSTERSLVYLDSAATTQKPQVVIDALSTFYTHDNANVHRGVYALAEQATEKYELSRAIVANFIGAQTHELVFVPGGTTFGINCVAQSWALAALKSGDEIVLTELEHHANILPWFAVAHQTGAVIKYIPIDATGIITINNLEDIICRKTKLVSFCLSSHAYSTIIPYQQIIARAKEVGALVLVDAAQAVAHQQINVKELNIDFMAFSGHKMFGPTGIGALFINEAVHDQIKPFLYGGAMVALADFRGATWQKLPYRLEAGTPPIAQAIGLAAAATFINTHMPFESIKLHEKELFCRAVEGLGSIDRVAFVGDVAAFGHVISFTVAGAHAHDIASLLDQHGVCVRAGTHCAQPLAQKLGLSAWIRLSLAGYNDYHDIERFITALKAILRIL
jgi:cysteine desulfurase / selenocysteine lyase